MDEVLFQMEQTEKKVKHNLSCTLVQEETIQALQAAIDKINMKIKMLRFSTGSAALNKSKSAIKSRRSNA